MTRPSTEGCTELSCVYHGYDNRKKREHGENCDVRKYTGAIVFTPPDEEPIPGQPTCTCKEEDYDA